MFWPAVFGGTCVLFIVATYIYIRLLVDMFAFVMVIFAVILAAVGLFKLRRKL